MLLTIKQFRDLKADVLLVLIMVIVFGVLLFNQRHDLVYSIKSLYAIAGPVMYALGPLTMLLASVAVFLILNPEDFNKVIRPLAICMVIATPLGFLGTALGFMSSIEVIEVAKTVPELIENLRGMFNGIRLALSTTAWGLIILIISLLLAKMYMPLSEKDKEKEIDELKQSVIGLSGHITELNEKLEKLYLKEENKREFSTQDDFYEEDEEELDLDFDKSE